MNRNALSKKFNRLSIFVAIIPFMIAAYMLFQSSDPLSIDRLVLPVLGYALFLCCLIILVYIFNKTCKKFTLQLETLSRESQKRNAELNALREISDLTKNVVPADDLLKLILDKAMQVIAVRNGSLYLVDPSEADGLRLVAAKPPIVLENDGGDRKSRRYSFVKSVIESGKTLRIHDIESDPRTMTSNDPKYQSPSFISMPVYKNKQVIAVMNLANKENGGVFTENDERTLSIMLGAIGVGIENINLQNTVKKQLTEIKDLTAMLKK